jgi:FkbM family methyltransferase
METKTISKKQIEHDLLYAINNPDNLCSKSITYNVLDEKLRKYFEFQFKNDKVSDDYWLIDIPLIGKIMWPSDTFGKLDHSCFFILSEMLVWLTYKYPTEHKNMWDVGAHTGIDTIIMGMIAESIISFEPDVRTYEKLKKNLEKNKISNKCQIINAGLSHQDGIANFVSVQGNTTASHLVGFKSHHGPVEHSQVKMVNYNKYKMPNYAKINIEGFEKELIPKLSKQFWESSSAIIEIHSEECAKAVFDSVIKQKLNIYSQITGFSRIENFNDMPMNNKDGYAIISKKYANYWWFC